MEQEDMELTLLAELLMGAGALLPNIGDEVRGGLIIFYL